MAELREAHLRYLLAIYELGRNDPDMGTQAAAKALNLAPLCYFGGMSEK